MLESRVPLRVFYDLDTPVTLARLAAGQPVDYLPGDGLAGFDLVLSYTGGRALDALRDRLGARRIAPLYGSVDPAAHRPAEPLAAFRGDLSYLGTYSEDRQLALAALFLEPAHRAPDCRFVVAGALYPQSFPWTTNTYSCVTYRPPMTSCLLRVIAPHPERDPHADGGHGVLSFRAPVRSGGVRHSGSQRRLEGLDEFFTPDDEIVVAHGADDVLAAMDRSPAEITRIGRRGRERALACHTAD